MLSANAAWQPKSERIGAELQEKGQFSPTLRLACSETPGIKREQSKITVKKYDDDDIEKAKLSHKFSRQKLLCLNRVHSVFC